MLFDIDERLAIDASVSEVLFDIEFWTDCLLIFSILGTCGLDFVRSSQSGTGTDFVAQITGLLIEKFVLEFSSTSTLLSNTTFRCCPIKGLGGAMGTGIPPMLSIFSCADEKLVMFSWLTSGIELFMLDVGVATTGSVESLVLLGDASIVSPEEDECPTFIKSMASGGESGYDTNEGI